jgi:hypothetical protein
MRYETFLEMDHAIKNVYSVIIHLKEDMKVETLTRIEVHTPHPQTMKY